MEANNNPAAEPDDPVLADGWYQAPPPYATRWPQWMFMRDMEVSATVTKRDDCGDALYGALFHAYSDDGIHRGAHATLAEAKAAALKGA